MGAASGELHLEICLQDLQQDFMGTEVKVSDPVVSFRETVTTKSEQTFLSKSPNKHNRLFVEADTISSELCLAIDDGDVKPGMDPKIFARKLADEFGWDVTEARKIWAFGPEGTGPNLFDVVLHADAIHRGMGQVMPTARRVCFASLMT